jgi:UPF0755 protein
MFISDNLRLTIAIIFGILVVAFIVKVEFGAPAAEAQPERFVVPLASSRAAVAQKLKVEGFVKIAWPTDLFLLARTGGNVAPGAYKISKNMNAWTIAGTLAAGPYMKWVVVPEGLRKEEIADILARTLDWSEDKKDAWLKTDTAQRTDYAEGVYFPDTYLIPLDESGADVAKRFTDKFNEKFSPYTAELQKQNVKWTTALKIASLVQRESAGKEDMPVVAGIIWNRLLKGMTLDIDATLQYARGLTDSGWWAPIKPADKKIDSPFNTYLRKGLPPRPIANPGLNAIEAAVYPAKTDCFYYLHDSTGLIHCARTYDEHKANIKQYLQ